MNNIFIFSGTSEGRQLSEYLCDHKISNEVFVATEYGEIVMKPSEYAHINSGRLDADEMTKLFAEQRPGLVIDATHPYAVEVTANIKAACHQAGLDDAYVRVSREIPFTEQLLKEDYPDIEVVTSTMDAMKLLEKTSGPILLTTGVKELGVFVSNPKLKDRIYARILPGKESMTKAWALDLLPRQIIAMEGPFSAETNEAIIRQYGIKFLVTKNSGIRGGFLEKLEACSRTGIRALVIDLSKVAEGISLEEAKGLIVERSGAFLSDISESEKVNSSAVSEYKTADSLTAGYISIVGIGMETADTITVSAMAAIEKAQVIIGAKRMAAFGKKVNPRADIIEEYDSTRIVEIIQTMPEKTIAVLVSGDTGFYSLATGLSEKLKDVTAVRIFPGISSFSYLSSRIGIPYSDGQIKSFHGKLVASHNQINDGCGKSLYSDEIKLHGEKVFCIFSGACDLQAVIKANPDYDAKVGFNLGQTDEKIFEISSGAIKEQLADGLYTACFIIKIPFYKCVSKEN